MQINLTHSFLIVRKENSVVDEVPKKLPPVTTKLNTQQQITRSCLQQDSAVSSSTQAEPPCKQVTMVVSCQPQDESGQLPLELCTAVCTCLAVYKNMAIALSSKWEQACFNGM